MSTQTQPESGESVPFMQRVYDHIWLLAIAAMVFFFVSYVAWGWWETITVPGVVV